MVAAHQTRQSEHAEAIGVQQRCRLEFVGTRQFAAAKPLQGGQQRFQASDGARDVTDDSSVTCDDWHETAVLRPSAGTVLPGSAHGEADASGVGVWSAAALRLDDAYAGCMPIRTARRRGSWRPGAG